MVIKLDKTNPENLWLASESMELSALNTLSEQLQPFETLIQACYGAGVQAATLPGKSDKNSGLKFASLFLKKALNDLRSAWILVRIGYTSQAAAVVATLFENALTVNCLAGQSANVKKLKKNKSGDLPWTPIQLSKILAGQWRDYYRGTGETFEKDDYELAWREIYAGYKWLCKVKHPTMDSVLHDAKSTATDPGEYVIMAAPDIRPENLAVKATILVIALSRLREAIRSFVLARQVDETSQEYKEYSERMVKVLNETKEAYNITVTEPLPFVLGDSSLKRDFARLKAKTK